MILNRIRTVHTLSIKAKYNSTYTRSCGRNVLPWNTVCLKCSSISVIIASLRTMLSRLFPSLISVNHVLKMVFVIDFTLIWIKFNHFHSDKTQTFGNFFNLKILRKNNNKWMPLRSFEIGLDSIESSFGSALQYACLLVVVFTAKPLFYVVEARQILCRRRNSTITLYC